MEELSEVCAVGDTGFEGCAHQPDLALQRSGRSYRALCPFHAEKTPSFYVFPETQTWKCFGCGVGGDAFSYLMQRDNLDFNAELVKQGYACAYIKYPTQRGQEFVGYQQEARNARRGLWADRK